MKSTKNLLIMAGVSLLVSVVVVYASNNVDPVKSLLR
jgi:hypothetical protein